MDIATNAPREVQEKLLAAALPAAQNSAVHSPQLIEIAQLMQDQYRILASFPMALRYLIGTYDKAKDIISPEATLVDGLRGKPSERTKDRIDLLRDAWKMTAEALAACEMNPAPESVARVFAQFTVNKKLVQEVRPSHLDFRNISNLIETRGDLPSASFGRWEVEQRRQLDDLGGRFVALATGICDSYRPLALGMAKKFSNLGVEFDDLYQEGCRGLIYALREFEPERGAAFPAYAEMRVHNHLADVIEHQSGFIRLSWVQHQRLRVIEAAEEKYLHTEHRLPSPSELSCELEGLSPKDIEKLKKLARPPESLDATVESEDGGSDGLLNVVGFTLPADVSARDVAIKCLMLLGPESPTLTHRQKEVFKRVMGVCGYEPMEFQQTADELGCSRQAATACYKAALHNIRGALGVPDDPSRI